MIEKHNFHWKEGFFYGFPIKRELFAELARNWTPSKSFQ